MIGLIGAWRRLRISQPRYTSVVRLRSRAEMPVKLIARRAYIIGPERDPKWIVLRCPCGHGHQIDLPLNAGAMHGAWHFIEDGAGRLTVHPSIDVRLERRCHFWLRDGRVSWVADLVLDERSARGQRERDAAG